MQRSLTCTALLLLATWTPAQQTEPDPAALMAMAGPRAPALQEMQNLRLGSGHVRAALRKLRRSLQFYDDLDDAVAAAHRTGKPILWIQALGDLQGYA